LQPISKLGLQVLNLRFAHRSPWDDTLAAELAAVSHSCCAPPGRLAHGRA
jgi:hypothetical protein